jgi:hypothetical protein
MGRRAVTATLRDSFTVFSHGAAAKNGAGKNLEPLAIACQALNQLAGLGPQASASRFLGGVDNGRAYDGASLRSQRDFRNQPSKKQLGKFPYR